MPIKREASKQKLSKNFGKVGSWTGGIGKKYFKNVKVKTLRNDKRAVFTDFKPKYVS